MPINQARVFNSQQTHYLRKKITFATAGLSTGVRVGTVPAGSVIDKTTVLTSTAWNGATSVQLSVGYTGTGNQLVSAADIRTAAVRTDPVPTIANAIAAAETDIYVSVAHGGAPSAVGETTIVIPYTLNNDA